MVRLLNILDTEVCDLAAGRDHDLTLMSDIVDYFNHYPTRFHHPYEDKIFKWVGVERPALLSLVDELHAEHEAQAELGSELAMFLQAIRSGHVVPRGTMVTELSQYIEVQRSHIDKEEGRLLKEIEKLLDAQRMIEVPIPDRATLDPLFGDKIDAAFSSVADALRMEAGT